MLCDVVVFRRRGWAHAPVIHAASHFYHEKRVAWVSISMHTCDPVPIVMGLYVTGLNLDSLLVKNQFYYWSNESIKLISP